MTQFSRLRDVGLWRELAAASWKAPNDPTVYGTIDVDFTNGLSFLDKLASRSPTKITVTHVVAKAVALMLQKFPEANTIIRRGRFYQRKSVDLFLQVSIEASNGSGTPDLSGAKIEACETKSVVQIAEELKSLCGKIRSRQDPQFRSTMALLKWMPRPLLSSALRIMSYLTHDVGIGSARLGIPKDPFGCAMVTNVGSLGSPAAFVPFLPLARTPLLICAGDIRQSPWVVDGAVVVRPILNLVATFDHRYMDGVTAARMRKYLVEILEDPGEFLSN